jgi:hypothetical protein
MKKIWGIEESERGGGETEGEGNRRKEGAWGKVMVKEAKRERKNKGSREKERRSLGPKGTGD